ncbi:hypothetical protein IWX49DRAFT_71204 [Phyllosticta citricarpa]
MFKPYEISSTELMLFFLIATRSLFLTVFLFLSLLVQIGATCSDALTNALSETASVLLLCRKLRIADQGCVVSDAQELIHAPSDEDSKALIQPERYLRRGADSRQRL